MGQTIFTGIATALITPFTETGVDYEAYGRLIDWQIACGVDALVAAGTSGEGSTLTVEEHKEVIRFTVARAAGRVPVIAGTGSNCTIDAIDLSVSACENGADALLVVTPYYNKATQKGLIAHFTAVADAVNRPIILYNVPSRTGCNILPTTYETLAEHPNIQAIKEAGGNISQIVETAARLRGKLDLYSGNDDQIIPLLAVGGKGCISVLSNLMPAESHDMVARFLSGDISGAAKLQFDLLPLIHALFSEVNPIPVKAAMAAMGYCRDIVRAPLTTMEPETCEILYARMRELNLI